MSPAAIRLADPGAPEIGHVALARDGRRFARVILFAVVGLNLFVGAWIGRDLIDSRRQVQEAAQVRTQNLARSVDQALTAVVERIDHALLTVRPEYLRLHAERRPDWSAVERLLAGQEALLPADIGLRIIDQDGLLRFGRGLDPARPIRVGDRPFFTRAREQTADRLIVSPPIQSRVSQDWVMVFARRITLPDGGFGGVLLGSIGVDALQDLIARFAVGQTGMIVLRDRHLGFIARHPDLPAERAIPVGDRTVSESLRQLVDSGITEAPYIAPAPMDQVPRVIAYRALEKGEMLILSGLAETEVFAPWQRQMQATLAVFAGFVLVTGLSGFAIVRMWRRRLHDQARLQAMVQEREYLSAIVRSSEDSITAVTLEGVYTSWNAGAEKLFGYAASEMIGTSIFSLVPESEVAPERERLVRVGRGESVTGVEAVRRHRDGHEVVVSLSISPIRGADGEVIGASRIAQDLTERIRADRQLRILASVFEASQEGIVITDAEATIVDVNPAFSRVTGYSREEAIGQNPRLLHSGRHDAGFFVAMWDSLAQTGQWRGEIWNRRKTGEIYPELLSISAVKDARGNLQHYLAVFTDITQIKQHEAELDRIAHYDPLTGVPNRRLLADRMQQALARTRRAGSRLAVCYLDLDGFKPVNDAHGHDAGDHLLIAVVDQLQAVLRGEDTLSRLGGDEFVLLLGDIEDVEECVAIVERLLAAIRRPVRIGEVEISISASIGATLFPDDSADADTLLRHADQAMYQAKEAGKNRFQLFDPDQERRLRARQDTARRLAAAIADGELVLHYQPKVNLRTGAVVGAEALVRWQHPQRGLLPPGEFLPGIEGTPLDIALGEWVLAAALTQMTHWQSEGLNLGVSVNISGAHLLTAAFSDSLAAALARHPGLSPAQLEIEVLETAAIGDIDAAAAVLHRCAALGVGIALDDFGTGYASLAWFRRLPVALLKIDRSFVRDMLDDPDDSHIVESVVRLARAFGCEVIAEGAETLDHCAALLRNDCTLAQGYAVARPMPPEQIPQWIATWTAERAWEGLVLPQLPA